MGLLVGIRMPLIGIAAAAGLAPFFVCAISTQLRACNYSLARGVPVVYLLIAVAALVLGVYGRKTKVDSLWTHPVIDAMA